MCGISGVFNSKPDLIQKSLQEMSDAIIHRGPDDYGYFIYPEAGVGLASRRLSIIDLSENGRMPMKSEDGNIVVVQNGEIYNFISLSADLKALGHSFSSGSDTEVIVHGYEEWGVSLFSKLEGMFAIAIYDLRDGRLYLARDRFGIKPIYYFRNSTTLYFSSEVKSFLALGRDIFSRVIDHRSTERLIGFTFFPSNERSLFRDVKKISPGTYITVNRYGEVVETKYYDLRMTPQRSHLDFDSAVSELDGLLYHAVKSHLMSDVSTGILLSGGLDSSLLTAMVTRENQNPVLTYTAKFNHKLNESDNALAVAKYLGTSHSEILINPQEINNNIELVANDLDDLTSFDPGLITTKILCREIKKRGTTVLLLGEGADELFGGYSWFGLSQIPFSLLNYSSRSALYYYAISRNLSFKPKKYYEIWEKINRAYFDTDIFKNISNVELLLQLPNHLLMKVDKGSMSASIEARVPYLDRKVVEFVYNLPREYKLRGKVFSNKATNEKHILREVAKKYLPENLANRKKRGFMLPMGEVLESNIDKVKSYVLSNNSLNSALFKKSDIASLFERSTMPMLSTQREYLLWRLFLLEVWYRNVR